MASAEETPGSSAGRLSPKAVHVLMTTEEGTRCALLAAKRLADGFKTRIVLLVPTRASDPAPSDPASSPAALTTRRYEALASSVGVDADVVPCVCWRPDDVLHALLGRSSLVVIGGRRKRAWPSPEWRLANRLAGEGYPIVFAEIGAGSARAAAVQVIPNESQSAVVSDASAP